MEIFQVLASLLGLASESQAQGAQANLGYANLAETKRANKRKENLAESDREDAYGNKIVYDPVFGWQIKNTPMTKNILDAEQAETLASLTEDASRTRDQARRKEERSLDASAEFERAFNDFKYRPQKSEEEYIADATSEKMYARRKGADETAAAVNKALLRQGNSSAIPAVFKAARDAEADEFEQALLGGKRQGQQDYFAHENASEGRDMQELEFLRGIANDTTALPARFTNTDAKLTGMREQALQELISTISSNDAARQGAMGPIMQAAGNTLDFAPLASSLGKLFAGVGGGGGTGTTLSPGDSGYVYPRPREEGVRARLRAGF